MANDIIEVEISYEQDNLFVEQAEYLEPTSFEAWTAEHPDEDVILKKLCQTGAKLITGPRGSGKTTLLLKAYHKLLRESDNQALPVYVNFKTSLKLEPLYKIDSNAIYWFNQWLLFKIYSGIYDSAQAIGVSNVDFNYSKEQVENFTSQLELGQTDLTEYESYKLSIQAIENEIQKLLNYTTRTRCILLLDDAAHAFSPEQQRDFFDFFRQIKSKLISPKAAIYPGVTIYSPTFHLGHDAEEIDIWLKPNTSTYIPFLVSLLEKRLPEEWYSQLKNNEDLLKLLCYASFGMPRALLNMIRSIFKNNNIESTSTTFNRSTVLKAIKDTHENTLSLFRSLKIKLPIYSHFIETGEEVYTRAIDLIKIYNKDKPKDRQSVILAIQRPVRSELSKVLGFFQYSGLLLPSGEISRGEKGVFELYTIHYAALIERNVFFGRKSIKISDLVEALEHRHAHEFTRINSSNLVGSVDFADAFPLSLPPCQNCHTPRINESAKFCLNCGAQLKTISAFETIVSRDISDLPLTQKRVESIRKHSKLRSIKDILIDHENRELRKVKQVGPYWAKRIYSYAEEFIA